MFEQTDIDYSYRIREGELVATENSLVARAILPITAGISHYQLPSDVLSLRRIIYKGKKLDYGGSSRSRYFYPFNTSNNEPKTYQYGGANVTVIHLLPTPNETLADAGEDPWNVAESKSKCVIEYYCALDSSDVNKRLPDSFRDLLLRYPVLIDTFSQDTRANSIKIANKFKEREILFKPLYSQILQKPFAAIEHTNQSRRGLRGYRLPSNYWAIG